MISCHLSVSCILMPSLAQGVSLSAAPVAFLAILSSFAMALKV